MLWRAALLDARQPPETGNYALAALRAFRVAAALRAAALRLRVAAAFLPAARRLRVAAAFLAASDLIVAIGDLQSLRLTE